MGKNRHHNKLIILSEVTFIINTVNEIATKVKVTLNALFELSMIPYYLIL